MKFNFSENDHPNSYIDRTSEHNSSGDFSISRRAPQLRPDSGAARPPNMDALLEAALRIETYKHECRFCERRFKLKCNCVRHERIHTNEKPYKCRICLKAFILKKNMQDHERVHTQEKPFECGLCSRRFGRRNSMVRHSRIHTGEKPYSCEHCHKSFAWKAYLKRHFLNAHANGAKRRPADGAEAKGAPPKDGHEERAPEVAGAAVAHTERKRLTVHVRSQPLIEITSTNSNFIEVKHSEKVVDTPAERGKPLIIPATKQVIVRIPKSDYCKELKTEESYKLAPIKESQFNNLVTKKLLVRIARYNSDGGNATT